MAGISMRTVTNAAEVAGWIRERGERARDLTPAMKQIGEAGMRSIDATFRAEGRPHRWAPLSEAYKQRKKGPKILTETGMRGGLRGSISPRAGRREVVWGTNKIYARRQHLGGGGIPARPFLVIQDEDELVFLEIIGDHISGG